MTLVLAKERSEAGIREAMFAGRTIALFNDLLAGPEALLELREDHGGSTVIRRHEDALLLYDVPARQLADVDTRAALDALIARER